MARLFPKPNTTYRCSKDRPLGSPARADRQLLPCNLEKLHSEALYFSEQHLAEKSPALWVSIHYSPFNFKLQADDRPEDLFQYLMDFFEDNLLSANGGLTHHGDPVVADNDLSPSL